MKTKQIFRNLLLVSIFLALLSFSFRVKAQDAPSKELKEVDYKGEIIVDSDLDGLTDKGEMQIFGTDPGKLDTDGDGLLDGAEVLSGTDPLNASDAGSAKSREVFSGITSDAPWVWYAARVAGILAFIFLWITVFLGLSIRNPILKKIVEPIYSFDFHCFTAALAVFWAIIHGTSLLFDAKLGFRLKDVAIPFFSKTTMVDTNYLALGIMAFYMMVIMTATSYLKKRLNHKLWRVLHFLNPVAFVFVVVHGYMNGTDMKNFYIGSAFLFSSFLLVLIYLSSLVLAFVSQFSSTDDVK